MASFKVLLNIALISNRLPGKYQKVCFRGAAACCCCLHRRDESRLKADVCKFMLQQVLIVYCEDGTVRGEWAIPFDGTAKPIR
ncbi:hypothetical protein Zmor_015866 [Zophobas morio]|uniref:Uncharacterized protein n=1 Tax=Zophobas morio TaxID=2755281 RepID=A0AA38IK87_9CUCU|nr:hypothetical protein Zmor_015866 [Zophobas morio]